MKLLIINPQVEKIFYFTIDSSIQASWLRNWIIAFKTEQGFKGFVK